MKDHFYQTDPTPDHRTGPQALTVEPQQAIAMPQTAILKLHGKLDCSNYQDFLARAEAEIRAGCTHLIVDLSEVESLCLSDLVSLYRVASLLEQRSMPIPKFNEVPVTEVEGWELVNQLVTSRKSPHLFSRLCLISPRPTIHRCLQLSGFSKVVRVLPTAEEASAFFGEE